MREIGHDFAPTVKAILLDHPDDADDRHGLLRIEPEVPANRIVPRPKTLRELFVDNRHLLPVAGIVVVEISAFQQGDLHGAKVIGAGRPLIHLQFVARLRLIALHIDTAPTYPAGEGQHFNLAFRDHPGQAADPVANFPVELHDGFAVGILGAARRHMHRQHMIGGKSRRHILQPREAADQQSRADQQHQRKRQFTNHQQPAQPMPRHQQAAIGLAAASARFQGCVQIQLDGAPRRGQSEQKPGQCRDPKREQQYGAVDGDFLQPGNVAGIDGAHQVKAGLRDR